MYYNVTNFPLIYTLKAEKFFCFFRILLSYAKIVIILIIFYIKKNVEWSPFFPRKKEKKIIILFQEGKPCGA